MTRAERAEVEERSIDLLGEINALELDLAVAELAGTDVDALRARVEAVRTDTMRRLAELRAHPARLEIVH
jgi:hypothetical protein